MNLDVPTGTPACTTMTEYKYIKKNYKKLQKNIEKSTYKEL